MNGVSGPFPPTPRQLDVLRFITGYVEAHGRSPKFAEIQKGIGCSGGSRASVCRMISALEERGLLRRVPAKTRSIELLQPTAIPRSDRGEPLYFVRVTNGCVHNGGVRT